MIRRRFYQRVAQIIVISFLAFSVVSCNKDEESQIEKQINVDNEKISKYLSDSSIVAKKHASGFYYKVLTANESGKALAENNVVDFTYRITLLNGALIEETTASTKKAGRLKLMSGNVVPDGLDEGIKLMKVGEKYRFYMPSYLAYGSYSSYSFLPNTNFVIDITVTGAQSETDLEVTQLDSIDRFVKSKYAKFEKYASGLYFVDSIAGTGTKPHNGDKVTFKFTRKYLDGTVIKTVDDVSIYLGYGQGVQGLEEGLKLMREGGKAILVMPASIAFQESICVIPQKVRKELIDDKMITAEVLPYSIVQYVVELKSVN